MDKEERRQWYSVSFCSFKSNTFIKYKYTPNLYVLLTFGHKNAPVIDILKVPLLCLSNGFTVYPATNFQKCVRREVCIHLLINYTV